MPTASRRSRRRRSSCPRSALRPRSHDRTGMIEVNGLGKRFGEVVALDGVSFSAGDGRITGLLGPNGAGKSTCLRILSTVLKPAAGSARVGNVDVAAEPLRARRLLGVLPHAAGLYPQLTAGGNILYAGLLPGT